jgi:hypothetical protein
MECEEYLRSSRLFRCLRSGPHGRLVERYAARLVGDNLVRHGTWRCLNVVGGLLCWIASVVLLLGWRISRFRARTAIWNENLRSGSSQYCRNK